LINPYPLKFSDVLHITPTPLCRRNSRSKAHISAFSVSFTDCARADPSTCVTAANRFDLTR
jgi:hypothetical protein